jgi:hypothetical protein
MSLICVVVVLVLSPLPLPLLALQQAFSADVAEAYSKLTLLGELYENRMQARD